jgi:hypothetical protein
LIVLRMREAMDDGLGLKVFIARRSSSKAPGKTSQESPLQKSLPIEIAA